MPSMRALRRGGSRHPEARPRVAVLVVALTAVLFGSAGCGGDPSREADGAPSGTSSTPAGSGFIDADGLIAHVNGLITRDPLDFTSMVALYYAENDLQRQLLEIERQILPFLEFEYAMHQQFGVTFGDGARADGPPTLAPMSPAQIVERSDRRAVAETRHGRDTIRLQMVEIGGSWWLSGYTLEELLATAGSEPTEFVAMMRDALPFIVPTSRNLTPRIRAGEFRSAEEVQAAYSQMVQQHIRNNPPPP